MKRVKYKDLVWGISVLIFLLCVIEGFVYFNNIENTGLRLALNIENALKAYKIDPDINFNDAFDFWAATESTGFAYFGITLVTVLYFIALLLAPFCTVAILLTLAKKTWARICGVLSRKNKTRMLVVGSGSGYSKFLKNLQKKCRVTTFMKGSNDDEEMVEYLKTGVDIYTWYDDIENDIFTILKKKGKLHKFDSILLCDEAGLKNLSAYDKLLNLVTKSKDFKYAAYISNVPVYICANDEASAEIVRAYEREHPNKHYVVNIVNLIKLAVDKTLLEYPVHANRTAEETDVHLGIIGFGEYGRNMLIQALNMSVLSAGSTIRVDVFDKKMNDILGTFLKRFSVDVTDLVEKEIFTEHSGEIVEGHSLIFDEFMLDPEERKDYLFGMDGRVELHFWNIDANDIIFDKIMIECDNKMPFTYMVISTSDIDSISVSTIGIMDVLKKTGREDKVPIIVRTRGDVSMDIIRQDDAENKRSKYSIISIDQDEAIFSYENLTKESVQENAKRFNYLYDCVFDWIYDMSGKGENVNPSEAPIDEFIKKIENDEKSPIDIYANAWNKMLYQRESSTAQSMHQIVKQWLLEGENGPHYSTDKDEEILEMIEHRRWEIYMITHGYKFAPVNGKAKKDTVRKTHACIVDWEHMDDEPSVAATKIYDILPYKIFEAEKKTEEGK